ncbi:MAG: DUF4169 family protein [Rhizobiaceae bacterium]|nr:DUF4169 family protein [Rhizobiaceae bacterium]
MGDVVNLRHFRKRKSREDAARRAGENRTLHGETKAAGAARKAEADTVVRMLDAHKRDKSPDETD